MKRTWLLQIVHLFPRIERWEHRREIAHALFDAIAEAIALLWQPPTNCRGFGNSAWQGGCREGGAMLPPDPLPSGNTSRSRAVRRAHHAADASA
jgi:hypothetical protein